MGIQRITTLLSAALQNYDLTDLATVKDELDLTDGSKDKKLSRYISEASAYFVKECNRVFQAEELQDEFWPNREALSVLREGAEKLPLSRYPVETPIISVVENGVMLVEGVDFKVDYELGQLIRLDAHAYPSRWHARPVVAQFVGGFDPIPPDVAAAVIRMVSRRYNAPKDPNLKQRNIPGVIEQSWWIATGTDSGNMSPDIADILENYRVPVIA
jgi:hypothetical protein